MASKRKLTKRKLEVIKRATKVFPTEGAPNKTRAGGWSDEALFNKEAEWREQIRKGAKHE